MERGRLLYEGKAKKIFATGDPHEVIHYFKDDATAFNAEKRGTIRDKGIVNNLVSIQLFHVLQEAGIPTHFLQKLSDREMLTRHVSIVPLEVVVRNRATGSLVKRLGLEDGMVLDPPLLEFFYKNDDLGDPLVTEDHIRLLQLADEATLAQLKTLALRINEVLTPYFRAKGLVLVDFKLEFGFFEGQLVLADEISPDTCRLWDLKSGEILDKDRFRKDLGHVEEGYQEVLKRVCA